MRELAKYAPMPVNSPLEELAKLAGEAVRMREYLLRRINSDDVSGAETSAYERWLTHCSNLLTSMARLGIEERRIQLSQRQAAIIVAAMTKFVLMVGLDPSEPAIREQIVLALTEARNQEQAMS